MKQTAKLFSLFMAVCLLLCSCAQSVDGVAEGIVGGENSIAVDNVIVNSNAVTAPTDREDAQPLNGTAQDPTPEKGTYNEGVVLVKYEGEFTENVLSQLDFVSAEPLYHGSEWYTVTLGESMDTAEAVEYLNALGCFAKVDFDYVMKADGTVEVSSNPSYELQKKHHGTHKIPEGWQHVKDQGKDAGANSDVIIAIIDTGVDYNHLDLRNNIWVNPAEIPDNGIDDDNNGYVDDIHGWDCVGNDNDPMDDNGHGTHVAGIAAAENNDIGGVGIAYDAKIMVLKAGNSSGYFNSSDIAEAVQYAYMNGASVINMSFGGSSISRAVEEALQDAYNQCVLVAAAGNNGLCNYPNCGVHIPAIPSYPGALPYVIGVMSCNAEGTIASGFSNFDHVPYSPTEYDVYACGENVYSTWPGNGYATLSGTSMASPAVAGMAAVLRAANPDRDTYSTKYITSQIVNTYDQMVYVYGMKDYDAYHGVANLYNALTEVPAPYIYSIYDQYIFDNVEFSPKNNGNGVIDAGETIRLAIELQNRGGMASNVVATLDTVRNDDPNLTDPYFTIVKDTVNFSDIGTYSVRDCGKIYDEDDNLIGTEKYFEIIVSEDCPNAYLVDFNVRLSYENGLDEDDENVYTAVGSVRCNVNRGYHLSGTITEDTVFEADRLYIVSSDVVIPAGVTVTFKEGCEIQFYDNREYYNSPVITVYGTLNFEGTAEDMVQLHPDELHNVFVCKIHLKKGGVLNADYLDSTNLYFWCEGGHVSEYGGEAYFKHSYLKSEGEMGTTVGSVTYAFEAAIERSCQVYLSATLLDECYVECTAYNENLVVDNVTSSFVLTDSANNCWVYIEKSATNNVFCSGDTDGATRDAFGGYYRFSTNYTNAVIENNLFYALDDSDPLSLCTFSKYSSAEDVVVTYKNNTFSKGYQTYASQVIDGYYDESGNPTIDVFGSCSDLSLLYPHVASVEMFNKDGEAITKLGREEITVRVTFNRAMDTEKETYLYFGTVLPYADYRIDGEWVSETVWEGSYTLKAQIENGLNYLKVENACAAEDPTMVVFGDYQLHEFSIDTTAAMSMNLLATPLDNGIELTWAQDDYDTLLGYNIYRAESKDGNYVKLNPAILLSTDESFLDENAEPGKTYWYTYTVVLSDFTESNPAGKVVATAKDTMAPNLYHTPVNQGYLSNNLVISCTASDNVGITSVVLYYRAVGATEWKSLTMSRQNDKYSATVFGSELTLDGMEYYIVANDTLNSITKGSAQTPYTVLIKDASAISHKGDVDGDGVVTTKDALMLMQSINEERILTDDEFKRADLNGDGILSSFEALRILQYINGNVTTLEM